jgi:thymidylate synthase
MIASICDFKVGEFIWSGGDCHIYSNHFQQVEQQLSRTPGTLPVLSIKRKVNCIDDFQFEDFEFDKYCPQPHIKAKVAV